MFIAKKDKINISDSDPRAEYGLKNEQLKGTMWLQVYQNYKNGVNNITNAC